MVIIEDVMALVKPILGKDASICSQVETNNNTVFIVKAVNKEYIVKLYSYKNWPETKKVPYINQLLQNHNIPCAKIHTYDRVSSKFENGFIIEEKIEGVPILSKDGIPLMSGDKFSGEFDINLYGLLAKQVSKVHKITFPQFGYINSGHPIYNTFHEFMEEITMQNVDGLIENNIFKKSEIGELVHKLCRCLREYHDLKPILCHGDLSMRNVLYNEGTLTLIDWDDAMALPWMVDVAYLTYPLICGKVKQIDKRKAFLDYYETDGDIRRFDGFEKYYHIFLSIKYLNWFYKYNQGKGTERIKKNLNALLKVTGLNISK